MAAAVVAAAHVQIAAQSETRSYVLSAGTWGAAQTAAVEAAGGTVTFSHEGAGVATATSSDPAFLDNALRGGAIAQGAEDVMVEWQRPTETVDATAVDPTNDTYYPIQWAPGALDAPAAWAEGCTGSGVRVAIVDGGLYNAHPDLAANIDTSASRSFVPGQPYNNDTGTFWHGTHVAGIVGAIDNGTGVIGIAPNATLIGVKVLHSGSGSFGWVIQGILYAATPAAQGGGGADIINMSLGATFARNDEENRGSGPLIAALAKAVNYADRHGVLVVSAAGNEGLDLDHSASFISVPAQSGSGIAVSATAPVGWATGSTNFSHLASYSNFGNSAIWVSAPGGDFSYPGNENCTMATVTGTITRPCYVFDYVLSTSRGGYSWAVGTSMAAPAASAVAAIAKSSHPGISLGALKALLAQSATDEGKIGNDAANGKGFVNALRACTR